MERVPDPLLMFFGRQLRLLREAKGWSQEALGKRIGYSGEMVSEVGRRTTRRAGTSPPRATASSPRWAACSPRWLRRRRALAALPVVVPDLGRRREARECTPRVGAADRTGTAPDRRLRPCAVRGLARGRRQPGRRPRRRRPAGPAGHLRPPGPALVRRSHRRVSPLPVRRQSRRDARPVPAPDQDVRRPRVSVQVLPAEVGAHVGLGGAFVIASFVDDTPGMAYFETADEGEVSRRPAKLARMTVTYDALKDDALNARASRALIRKVAEETWKA